MNNGKWTATASFVRSLASLLFCMHAIAAAHTYEVTVPRADKYAMRTHAEVGCVFEVCCTVILNSTTSRVNWIFFLNCTFSFTIYGMHLYFSKKLCSVEWWESFQCKGAGKNLFNATGGIPLERKSWVIHLGSARRRRSVGARAIFKFMAGVHAERAKRVSGTLVHQSLVFVLLEASGVHLDAQRRDRPDVWRICKGIWCIIRECLIWPRPGVYHCPPAVSQSASSSLTLSHITHFAVALLER